MHVSIRIKGHLDLSWQDYLEGLEIVYEADAHELRNEIPPGRRNEEEGG